MIVCDENKGKPKKEQKKSEDCKGKQSRKGPVHLILMSKLEWKTWGNFPIKIKAPSIQILKAQKVERKVSLPVVYGGKLSKEEMNNLDRTVGKDRTEFVVIAILRVCDFKVIEFGL